jgi:hypothetical protein
MSREPKPADAVRMRLDLSPEDRDRVRVAAALAGMEMTAWLRKVTLEAVGQSERNASAASIGKRRQ